MKKIQFLCVLFLACSTSLVAQKIGVQMGIGFSGFGGDAPNAGGRTHLPLGAFGVIPINDFLAFQPEIEWDSKGGDIAIDATELIGIEGFEEINQYLDELSGISYSDKLNYLNIPLNLNFYPTETFYLQGGIYVGFLTGGKRKLDVPSIFPGFQTLMNTVFSPTSITEYYKNIDAGISLGAGMDLGKINLNFRYGMGFPNINAVVNELSKTNRFFKLRLGVIVFQAQK